MENRNEVKIGEGTYIVERSFTPGKSVKDLLVQRLISEKKKDDAKKKDDLTGDRRKFCVIDEPRQYENHRLSQE